MTVDTKTQPTEKKATDRTRITIFFDKGIEDKKRTLVYNVNSLADFEQEVGMGFGMLMQSRAVFAATRALLWSGAKTQDRTFTIDKAGELIQAYVKSGGNVGDVLAVCMEAAMDQGALAKPEKEDDPFAEDDEDDDEDEESAARPTGPTAVPSASEKTPLEPGSSGSIE